jgi:hypothetical protein
MCAAMSRAQIMVFADDDEPAQVNGLQKRKRRSTRRRRRLRAPVELASMSARTPPVSLSLDGVSHPSGRASIQSSPQEGSPPRTMPHRVPSPRKPPTPETIAQLDAALGRVEKTLP